MKRISILLLSLTALFLSACDQQSKGNKRLIYVSIAPLKYLVEQIAEPQTAVKVLVPETSSPESYEPTPQQIQALSLAPIYISTGLIDFEVALEEKIRDIAPSTIYLNLSDGMDVLPGDCGHNHQGGIHYHGVDPHIWLSPMMMKEMGFKTAELLTKMYPNSAPGYEERATAFAQRVDSLDQYIREALQDVKHRNFGIGHSSLTYFARDYDLNQIAIEVNGKEPSAKAIKQIIESLQKSGVTVVIYQRQTNDSGVRVVARELKNGRAVEYDPLSEDWMNNMYRLADTLQVVLNN